MELSFHWSLGSYWWLMKDLFLKLHHWIYIKFYLKRNNLVAFFYVIFCSIHRHFISNPVICKGPIYFDFSTRSIGLGSYNQRMFWKKVIQMQVCCRSGFFVLFPLLYYWSFLIWASLYHHSAPSLSGEITLFLLALVPIAIGCVVIHLLFHEWSNSDRWF